MQRQQSPLRTTQELADLVRRGAPAAQGHGIDPATRCFQGLRIAVNDELGALERLLASLPWCLRREAGRWSSVFIRWKIGR